jgi:predicted ABC-type ATPase
MLDLIVKLLPNKAARTTILLLLLVFGGGWLAIMGKSSITAWAQEAATTQTKLIINDEVREAAKDAATDAAVKAARAAAKEVARETALDRAAIEQKVAEQEARIKKLETEKAAPKKDK